MSSSLIEHLQVKNDIRFFRQGHPFHTAPMGLLDKISSLSGYQGYASDFLQWEGPNTAAEAGGWLLTEVSGGGGNANRVDIDDSATYGVLKLLTDNGANDEEILQMNGEPFKYVAGKQVWFFARVAVDDITKTLVFLGLGISDTTPITGLTDAIFFSKAAADAALSFNVEKNSTLTTDSLVASLTNGVFTIVGFHVDSSGSIHVYAGATIDALAEVGVVSNGSAGSANIPDDEDLHITIGVRTSETTGHYLLIDWLFVAQER